MTEKNAPSADRVIEVGRCKDCEYIVLTDNPMTASGYWCIENDTPRSLDGFCDFFEKRGTDEVESIYDWEWVREMVGEDEADRRKAAMRDD